MKAAIIILCFGLIFDALSFFYGVLGLVKKKHVSGFPIVGLVFYLVGSMLSILFSGDVFGFSIVSGLAILFAVHVIASLPGYMQGKYCEKNT